MGLRSNPGEGPLLGAVLAGYSLSGLIWGTHEPTNKATSCPIVSLDRRRYHAFLSLEPKRHRQLAYSWWAICVRDGKDSLDISQEECADESGPSELGR